MGYIGLPWWEVKNPPALWENLGFNPCFGKTPLDWLPIPVFLPEEFHGQRSLAGYNPWGHKELDMTELYTTLWSITQL